MTAIDLALIALGALIGLGSSMGLFRWQEHVRKQNLKDTMRCELEALEEQLRQIERDWDLKGRRPLHLKRLDQIVDRVYANYCREPERFALPSSREHRMHLLDFFLELQHAIGMVETWSGSSLVDSKDFQHLRTKADRVQELL